MVRVYMEVPNQDLVAIDGRKLEIRALHWKPLGGLLGRCQAHKARRQTQSKTYPESGTHSKHPPTLDLVTGRRTSERRH